MPKFTLKKNEFSGSRLDFYNLVIKGRDQFEAFREGLEDIYESKYKSLCTWIMRISEKQSISWGKKKKIQGVEDAWELRSGELRLYYFELSDQEMIICLGGLKRDQKKHIKKIKRLRKQVDRQIKLEGSLKRIQ